MVADAQQDRKVYRLGILTVAPERNWDGMFQELRDLGYIEGQNLIVEWRYSEGHAERWADLANALVGLKVEVIVVSTTPAALAAKNATSTVGSRPSYRSGDLVERNQPSKLDCMEGSRNHRPRALGLALRSQSVREPKDLEAAFAAITQERTDRLLVLVDAFLMQHRNQIVGFTTSKKLPAVFPFREFTELGGLMSYGPNLARMRRVGANYVDNVLKGAKPADLPIEQPTKFEFVLNLKTAKGLGLNISSGLIARADEVIE